MIDRLDEVVREALAIEIDTSLPAGRVIRVLERLKENRGMPRQICVDNRPEFIFSKLIAWCETNHFTLHYVQPGKSTRTRVSNASTAASVMKCSMLILFDSLNEVREDLALDDLLQRRTSSQSAG